LALLDAFAIPHSVVMDGDKGDEHHAVINDLVEDMSGKYTLCEPFRFANDLEGFLGLPKPPGNRNDRKPISVLRAVSAGELYRSKLELLKMEFTRVCAVEAQGSALSMKAS
jgi:putative ATP-dependent endonuclease of OLD family